MSPKKELEMLNTEQNSQNFKYENHFSSPLVALGFGF